MLIEPSSDPGVVTAVIVRIGFSPSGIVFCFQRLLTRWIATGFLPLADSWIWDKGILAIWTRLPFHLGFLRDWNDSNDTIQRKKKTKRNEKEKNLDFSLGLNNRNYKKGTSDR
jgi:hypothetical protein